MGVRDIDVRLVDMRLRDAREHPGTWTDARPRRLLERAQRRQPERVAKVGSAREHPDADRGPHRDPHDHGPGRDPSEGHGALPGQEGIEQLATPRDEEHADRHGHRDRHADDPGTRSRQERDGRHAEGQHADDHAPPTPARDERDARRQQQDGDRHGDAGVGERQRLVPWPKRWRGQPSEDPPELDPVVQDEDEIGNHDRGAQERDHHQDPRCDDIVAQECHERGVAPDQQDEDSPRIRGPAAGSPTAAS